MVISLKRMFNPKSVALIGASKREHSVGSVVAKNLLRNGYDGIIMPVNPKEKAIEGVLTYNSIHDLPMVPDLAVICTPASGIPEIVRQLGEKGTKSAVIISAGLGEGHGPEGARLKKEVEEHIETYDMRIVGPNCVGIIVPELKLNASFCRITPKPGKIGFISQSGAVVTSFVDWAASKGIGFSHIVSMGDMLDVKFGEMIQYFADDPNTESIIMYIEAISDPEEFVKHARKAAKEKPIIVIKPGRHAESAAAAASHTGALAGVDGVYDAIFKRCGILRVLSMTELFDAVETMARAPKLKGDRLCVLTNGGGIGVIATDGLLDAGGKLAKLEEATMEKLNHVLPKTWSHGNPVDIIGDADSKRYADSLQCIMQDKNVDAILALNCPVAIVDGELSAKALVEAYNSSKAKTKPPLITAWLGVESAHKSRKIFIENGIPTYPTPTRAITGFKHMLNYMKVRETCYDYPIPKWKLDKSKAEKYIKRAIKEERAWLTEPEAKEVLDAYGIPVIKSYETSSVEEAAKAAKQINDVVVLKINSYDITHKSDYGGVRLNLKTPEEVKIAAENMLESFKKSHPKAEILGFSVQQMVQKPGGHELILGVFDDPTFGPVILFGAGGKAVEVIEDKALGIPPINQKIASHMIEETKIYKLLKGYRDEPPVDLAAINECLVRLSLLIRDFPQIKELDINPLIVDKNGVIAVDGRVLIEPYHKKGNRFIINN